MSDLHSTCAGCAALLSTVAALDADLGWYCPACSGLPCAIAFCDPGQGVDLRTAVRIAHAVRKADAGHPPEVWEILTCDRGEEHDDEADYDDWITPWLDENGLWATAMLDGTGLACVHPVNLAIWRTEGV